MLFGRFICFYVTSKNPIHCRFQFISRFLLLFLYSSTKVPTREDSIRHLPGLVDEEVCGPSCSVFWWRLGPQPRRWDLTGNFRSKEAVLAIMYICLKHWKYILLVYFYIFHPCILYFIFYSCVFSLLVLLLLRQISPWGLIKYISI